MNKNNAAQFLPLVQALAEGKTLQFFDSFGWCDVEGGIGFNNDPSKYRIKSEPRVCYAIQDDIGVGAALYSPQERNSQDKYRAGRGMAALKWIKFVEEMQP